MAFAPFILMGSVSLLLQITVLRELLTVFSGNELDIGITLSVWLVSVGLGSHAGGRAGRRLGLGITFAAVALVAGPTMLGIGLIRPALGLELGETASLGATFLSTGFALFPLCFLLGVQFPLAVRHMEENPRQLGRGASASRVYGLEAAGAFMGGVVFTLVLSGRTGPDVLVLALSAIYVLLAAYVLKKKAALVLLIVPLAFYAAARGAGGRDAMGGHVVEKVWSRYGEVLVTERSGQYSIYGAGHLLYSYPDTPAEETGVHIPMSLHPGPRRVLAIGGSPGRLREFVKYPIEALEFVEMDPRLIEASFGVLVPEDAGAARDKRIRVVAEDGRRFVKASAGAGYDLVVLSLPAPSTANANRFYTVEFFGELKRAMAPGGVLTLTMPTSAGYAGRRMVLSNGSVFNSLSAVFDRVEVSTEEYGVFAASDSPMEVQPSALSERFLQRGVWASYFHPYILEDAFFPLRKGSHMARLKAVGAKNTDRRPASYLYNLMLWADMHGARYLGFALDLGGYTGLVLIGFFASCSAAVVGNRRRTLYYSMLTTGYAAMAFTVSLLLGYQASFGYVYEMFGLLSAVFMAGAAAGTFVMRKASMRTLLFLELLTAGFSASYALFFRGEAMYYLFALLAGVIAGCAFRATVLCMRHPDPSRAGGALYAYDLAGSFLGAVLTSIIFVPVVGVGRALLVAGGLKLVSAAMVFRARDV